MAQKTIKHLQFWYTAEIPVPGGTALAERIAQRGETVDITDDYDLQRGEAEDAFMSADEKKEFDEARSPYDVATAEELAAASPPMDTGDGTPAFDWDNASPDDMADFMEEHSMTVNQVLEVANAHPTKLDEILEAEGIVTGDEPRKGVTEGIEKIAKQQSE